MHHDTQEINDHWLIMDNIQQNPDIVWDGAASSNAGASS